MKIVSLTSNNVLRLDAVEITPQGNAVIIGGENGQGKTSVLDSIVLALGGKQAKHQKPLKDGKKKGKIVCELDDLIVTRTFTDKGTGSLVVENKEGSRFNGPQTMLDKLTGQLTFDPLAWSNMDAQKQRAILKNMVGLDFTEDDKKRQDLYDERTEVNRDGISLKAKVESMPDFEDLPDEEIKIQDLVSELETINNHNKSIKELEENINGLNGKIGFHETEAIVCNNAIADAKAIIKLNEEKMSGHEKEISGIKTSRDSYQKELESTKPIKLDPIKEKMSTAEETNRKIRVKNEKAKLVKTLQEKRKESTDLTSKIEAIDESKATKLSEAKFPAEGMSFDEDGVLFNGVPFAQASSADRLGVSVDMGIAMNPELRVLLIRDGSLLDENSLNVISEKAKKADMQIWIERVGKGKECQVIIEDGKVLPQ